MDLVGFDGGTVVWERCLLLVFLFDFCLIIYIYFYGLYGWIRGFRVVSIALFTWCFVVVCG